MVPRILQQLPPRFRKKQLSGMHGLGSFLHPCRPGLSLALHGTQSDSWTAPQSSASKGLHPRLQLHHPLSRSDQIHGHHPGLSFMAGRWQVFGKMLPLPPLHASSPNSGPFLSQGLLTILVSKMYLSSSLPNLKKSILSFADSPISKTQT